MASAATTRRLTLALTGAALLLGGCGDEGPARNGAGAIEKPGEALLVRLHAGDCVSNFRDRLEHPDGGHNGVPKVTAVNCAETHDAEILMVAPLGGGEWPGFAIVDGEAARGRVALQPRLVRAKRVAGTLTLVSFRPTSERWAFEDQHDILFIALYDKPRRGPAPA